MSTVRRKATQDQRSSSVQQAIPFDDGTVTTPVTLAMIQALIPLGLKAVEEALVREVTALAGPRYGRTMRIRRSFTLPWDRPRLRAMSRWLSCWSNRRRRASITLRMDTLSAATTSLREMDPGEIATAVGSRGLVRATAR